MDVHDSALKNVLGHATSYHLVPLGPRHLTACGGIYQEGLLGDSLISRQRCLQRIFPLMCRVSRFPMPMWSSGSRAPFITIRGMRTGSSSRGLGRERPDDVDWFHAHAAQPV